VIRTEGNFLRGSMTSRKVSTQKLAGTLSGIMGRPVLDMTGLTGVFDIDLRWTPDDTQFYGRFCWSWLGIGALRLMSPSARWSHRDAGFSKIGGRRGAVADAATASAWASAVSGRQAPCVSRLFW
jgi:uncharacterized protein (TIGR03435 family)